MVKNLYSYGLDFENLYGRNTTDYTAHGALLGELMRTRLRSEYNFKGGILED